MTDLPPPSPLPSARRVRFVAASIAAIGLVALAAAWMWWPVSATVGPDADPTGPADPRFTYPTPYRNVRPDVKYVGDVACADCHADQARTCRLHPMGLAMAPVASATPIEQYGPMAANPFVAVGLNYGVRRKGGRVLHREWAADAAGKVLVEMEAEVPFAIGSGTRARSYAISRDGYLFQSPITWYPGEKKWDISPGYEARNQHFNRPITPGCLFCHCSAADHVADTVNRYREPIIQGYSIGCERCHGPGQLHVARRSAGQAVDGLDDTIVNPAKLEHSLREAVCQQCHVQGEQRVVARGRGDFDYRPGLPLHLFLMDFVDGRPRGDDYKFVSSVEQMMASRCYVKSADAKKLGCISCHDPHVQPAPAEKPAHYRARCLACHTEQSCSLPVATRRKTQPDDSCVACHMPPTKSEVNHTSITDHRVPRRPPPLDGAAARRSTPGPTDLIPFHRGLLAANDPETARNLGLATMGMQDRGLPDAISRQFAATALPLLEAAVARDPRDFPAVESYGDALWTVGRPDEARVAYDAVLAAHPEAEKALMAAGNLARVTNRLDDARAFFERAINVNPWSWVYHQELARVSFRRKEWDRAIGECQQAVRLDPTNPGSRSLLVSCYLGSGRASKATAEYETLRDLTPADRRADLSEWFESEKRRLSR